MREYTIFNRIIDAYDKSIKIVNNSNDKSESIKIVTATSDEIKNIELSSVNELQSHNYSHPEIEGNYLLFFNNTYNKLVRKYIKKILKRIAWPILKRQVFFNATIRQILYGLVQKNRELSFKEEENSSYLHVLNEKIDKINLSPKESEKISKLEIKVEHLTQINQQLLEQISLLTTKIGTIPQIESEIAQIITRLEVDESLTIKSLSIEESRVASGLWFNEPINVSYHNDKAHWAGTTERIVEKNFILLSLARLYESNQVKILDVGSAESLLAYELASLNYSVTAIDIRPISLSHPNLKFIKSDICHPVLPIASFDCVIALSTLEHIGLGWYGDEVGAGLDRQAVEKIHSLIKPGGSFIMTVPYGQRALTPVHRIYDRESLQSLVQDFRIVRAAYGIRLDDFTYSVTNDEAEASLKAHDPNNYLPGAVAMLVCEKI